MTGVQSPTAQFRSLEIKSIRLSLSLTGYVLSACDDADSIYVKVMFLAFHKIGVSSGCCWSSPKAVPSDAALN